MFWCSSSASAFLPCPRQCSSSSYAVQRRTKGEGNDGRSWWQYPESNRGKHIGCNHLPLFFTLLKIATLLVFLTFSFMTSWSGFGTRSPPGTVNVQCSGSSWQGLLANIASLWNGNDRVLAVSTVQTKQGKMPSSSEALFLGQYWWNKAVKTSLPSSQLKWGQETRFTLVLHTHYVHVSYIRTMSTTATAHSLPGQLSNAACHQDHCLRSVQGPSGRNYLLHLGPHAFNKQDFWWLHSCYHNHRLTL